MYLNLNHQTSWWFFNIERLDRMNTDTHLLFKTINHTHIGNGEIELDVIECANGKWFVENRWGYEYFEKIEGISNPDILPYVNPIFFETELEAENFAVSQIQKILPHFTYDLE